MDYSARETSAGLGLFLNAPSRWAAPRLVSQSRRPMILAFFRAGMFMVPAEMSPRHASSTGRPLPVASKRREIGSSRCLSERWYARIIERLLMNLSFRTVLLGLLATLALVLWTPQLVEAQTRTNQPQRATSSQTVQKERMNAWTVGLAAGQLEGAPLRFATEIARVVDDGQDMVVLPIVTRGPVENLNDLLYLRGVD